MTKIVPAVLVNSKEDYISRLNVIRQLTNRFQLDVIDGEYVDNKTIQLEDISKLNEIKIDIHLMVKAPKTFVEKAISFNPNNIIIQFECGEDLTPHLERIKKSGLSAGVAINPETKLSKIKPLKHLVDHLLIMGYSAGFAGQKLDPIVFERLEDVKELLPHAEIGLDGGVNEGNAKKILQAGFDVVNINTLIFGSEDPLSSYMKLLEYTL
jgi:ribulose-phosphate 3-epimerase